MCHINPPKSGRYVGILTTRRQFLQLCEVEIFSKGASVLSKAVVELVYTALSFFIPVSQEKNSRFPFLDILGYLKNTNKNPKFGRVKQVPVRELGWEFPGWELSHFAKFGIFIGIL